MKRQVKLNQVLGCPGLNSVVEYNASIKNEKNKPSERAAIETLKVTQEIRNKVVPATPAQGEPVYRPSKSPKKKLLPPNNRQARILAERSTSLWVKKLKTPTSSE